MQVKDLLFPIVCGLIGGFACMFFRSLFISRRDKYVNSGFALITRKAGWFFVGFAIGFSLGLA
jgi:hypothetical protein